MILKTGSGTLHSTLDRQSRMLVKTENNNTLTNVHYLHGYTIPLLHIQSYFILCVEVKKNEDIKLCAHDAFLE